MRRVLITIVYGLIFDANVINAVYAAAYDLRKLGLEPVIVQVYNPGSKLRISVNGVYLNVDEDLIQKIVSTALETTSHEEVVDNIWFIRKKYVAGTEFRG